MLPFPQIDPVAFSIGPVQVHWYGLMYLVGFASAWWLARLRIRRPDSGWTAAQVDDLIFFSALGVVLGGRIGYVLFYNFSSFINDPLLMFRIWQGGMSFHGGAIGVVVALWFFARKEERTWLGVLDFLVPLAPLGLAAGRIGNFINGELWGKATDLPWGVIFPTGGGIARHPSQLYEALLEGVVLFIILWVFSGKPRPRGAVAGMFALFYGLFRFLVEFVREPDAHIGYLALDWLTMGQILSLPLIMIGLIVLWRAYSRQETDKGKKRTS